MDSMDSHEPDLARVLWAIRDHRMTIEMDQGVHRSLLFRRPGSSTWHFRLVTWPGHLHIGGDCEDFTFARTEDMFEFFRGDRINPGYWSEKLRSPDRMNIYREFSEARFHQAIRDHFARWTFSDDAERKRALARLEDVWDGLIGATPETEQEAMAAAYHYVCPETGQQFTDFWDNRVWDYSHHFIWCCRAIQWGIRQYDLHKAGRTQADVDRLVLAGAI